VEALAAAISLLLEDATRREELALRGFQRARLFSWSKTVAQTVEAYESVAANLSLVSDSP
jgi:glycosyltransferase involved in cell wall biosynthesis